MIAGPRVRARVVAHAAKAEATHAQRVAVKAVAKDATAGADAVDVAASAATNAIVSTPKANPR